MANEIIPKLVEVLNDKDEYIRVNAAVALGQLDYEYALDYLIVNLEHIYANNREKAALGIAKMGVKAKRAVPALINALRKLGRHNIQNAIIALESIGTPEALAAANEYKKRRFP